MLNKVKRRLGDSQDGFTLIELLVVITILGILAAVVVFSVGGIGDKGGTSACKADYTTVQTAQEAFFAQQGAYGTMEMLVGDVNGPRGTKTKVLSAPSKLYKFNGTPGTTYDIEPVTVADGLPSGFSAPCDPSP